LLIAIEESIVSRLIESLQSWLNGFIDLLPNLVLAVVIVAAFGFGSRYVQKAVCQLIGRMTQRKAVANLFANIAKLATVVVGVFIALGLLHLDKTVTSLLAGVGVVGLALGFAFQDIAANFVSGVLMVFRRPFADGDIVEIGGETGHVQKIELRATQLTTFDGLTVTLPNKEVFQNKIINYTRTSHRRVSFDVGVAYSDDLRVAQQTAVDAISKISNRATDRDVEVYYTSFGDSSINFTLRFWLNEADQQSYLKARSEAIMCLKEAFDKAEITIPFPIRTLDFGASEVGGETLAPNNLRVVKKSNSERPHGS